jgi:hypothetical protein
MKMIPPKQNQAVKKGASAPAYSIKQANPWHRVKAFAATR